MSDLKEAIVRISVGEGSVEDKILISNLDDKTFSDLYETMKIEKLDRLYSIENFYEVDDEEDSDADTEEIREKVAKKRSVSTCGSPKLEKARTYARNKAMIKRLLLDKRKASTGG